MKLAALVPLLVATTAHAQAPGDVAPEAPIAPPGMAAPVVVVAAPEVAVMENRWAVGLSVGSLDLGPRDTMDQKTTFGIGALSLRYRATLHLELELAIGGGREKLPDGTQGDREVSTGVLAARYRFRPLSHWNWWLMGGLGGVAIAPQGATDQQRQDAQRPLATLGIGLEHRWQQFAIHAELRALSAGPSQAPQDAVPVAQPAGTTMQPPPPTMSAPTDNLAGGMLTIGASYYF